jgi:hypothetical protein
VVRDAARAAVGVLAALALSGCMGGGGDGQSQVQGSRIARPTQLVQCRDWNTANPRERAGTLELLREFAGGPTGSPSGTGQTLEDDEAFALFDGWCSREYARGFRLYKLYTRAAAFKSLAE